MPIYEYRRPDGSTFEVLQSFADTPIEHDPETGVPVERVLHAPAVHFKGKGFYNTDYGTRKRQRESAAASENGTSPNGSGAGSGAGSGVSSTDGAAKGPAEAGGEGSSSGGERASDGAGKKGPAASKAEKVATSTG